MSEGTAIVSALYEAIPQRHTNRLDYDVNRPVNQAVIDRLTALNDDSDVCVFWVTETKARAHMGEQIVAATAALIADEQQSIDSHACDVAVGTNFKLNGMALRQLQGNLPPLLLSLKCCTTPTTSPPTGVSRPNPQPLRYTATAMGFGLIVVRDHMDNELGLRGGRLWQRIHYRRRLTA